MFLLNSIYFKGFLVIIFNIILTILILLYRIYIKNNNNINNGNNKKVIGFLHPASDAGGGGERVLWLGIFALLNSSKEIDIILYTNKKYLTKTKLINDVKKKFNINFTVEQINSLHLISLDLTFLLEAKLYPVATLIGQALGCLIVCLEVLYVSPPMDLICDTQGLAWGYRVMRTLAPSTKLVSYTHYPIISSDMINRISSSKVSYNNKKFISNSVVLSQLKIFYYNILSYLYSLSGNSIDLALVNSSWTLNHIEILWYKLKNQKKISLLYPPCNTKKLFLQLNDKSDCLEKNENFYELFLSVLSRIQLNGSDFISKKKN